MFMNSLSTVTASPAMQAFKLPSGLTDLAKATRQSFNYVAYTDRYVGRESGNYRCWSPFVGAVRSPDFLLTRKCCSRAEAAGVMFRMEWRVKFNMKHGQLGAKTD